MSYLKAFESNTSEKRWRHHINKTVSRHIVINVAPPPPLICRVPKEIVDSKPEAYIPQRIGLGPYHHFHAERQKVARHKFATIKEILSKDQITNFQSLVVDKIQALEYRIRYCYDEYLDLDGDTLAWILAIDGLFLLYRIGYRRSSEGYKHPGDHAEISCSSSYSLISEKVLSGADDVNDEIREANEEKAEKEISEKSSWNDIAKTPQELVINPRETLMLENQIPLIVLKELLNILHLSSPDSMSDSTPDSALDGMLSVYGEKHSPLKMLPRLKSHDDKSSPAHLLDYMYNLVVCNNKPEAHETEDDSQQKEDNKKHDFKWFVQLVDHMMKVALSISTVPDTSLPKPIQSLKKIFFITPLDYITGNSKLESKNVLEIDIPSVEYLYESAGVTFAVTDGGIRNIRFDEKELIFYLPVITLKANSEIILRNLIAYEQAINAPDSILELFEYVELMCGIVDTVKDVKMLKEKGVIKGNMEDDEIVKMFNGIPKCSLRPKKSSNTRTAFFAVKKHYNGRPLVIAYTFLKKQIVLWWKMLVIFFTFTGVAFFIYVELCTAYKCKK